MYYAFYKNNCLKKELRAGTSRKREHLLYMERESRETGEGEHKIKKSKRWMMKKEKIGLERNYRG